MSAAFGNTGYAAFALFALGLAALACLLPSGQTPNLDPAAFVGCYDNVPGDRLIVAASMVTIARAGQHTRVSRFFFLKNGPVMETVSDISIGRDGRLVIGAGDTGFFHAFEGWPRASALKLIDDRNATHALARVRC